MNTLIKTKGHLILKDSFRTLEVFINGVHLRSASSDTSSSDVIKKQNVPSFPSVGSLGLKRGTGGRSSFNGTVCTVFGATGFIGKSLINRLGRIGAQVIIPFRGEPYDVRELKLCGDLGQVLFFPYYLRNAESIEKVVRYSNVVINLVGKENETASFTFDEVHVEGARLIAKLSKAAGVQRFIHVSSLNVTPNPKPGVLRGGSKWLKSKYYGELAVREEFPEATIFRPADVFGDQDHFLLYLSDKWRRDFGGISLWKKGKGVYKQPVYLPNFLDGIMNSIYDKEAPGKVYDVVGPKRYEFCDIVQYIHRLLRRDETYGFKFTDLRFAPTLWAKTYWSEFARKYPPVCWEKIERETITDVTTPGNPTLEDLGVVLTALDDVAYPILSFRKRFNYYPDEVGEIPLPPPPKAVIETTN